MKAFLVLIVPVLLFSCQKNGTMEVLPPPITPTAPPDSAQMVYVTAARNGSSFYTLYGYGVDGQKRWEVPNLSPYFFQQAYADNIVYMSAGIQVYGWNAETGVKKWTNSNGINLLQPKLKGDTLITASTTLAPSANNQLLLFNKNTGILFWNKVVTEQPLVPPVLSEGKIYSLTTNGTGTQINLTAYDVKTKAQIWQKPSGGFLMSLPPEMIVRGDTLMVGTFSNSITLLNKHTGALYWSKSLNTEQSFLSGGEIVYNDQDCACVKKISLQNGAVTFQGETVNRARFDGQSYIYDNHFYYRSFDSLIRTSLVDGSVRRTKVANDYYTKLTVVGKTVYAAKVNYALNDESRIMILQADDLLPKDSIRIPAQYIKNFSVLSVAKQFY